MRYHLHLTPRLFLRSGYNTSSFVKFPPFGRRFKSDSTKEESNHSSETYHKDETISDPMSSKTHVVDGHEKTQRPFEPPAGPYATGDAEQPYDEPIPKSENNHKKPRYGNMNRGAGGGTTTDVDPTGNPTDQGREGRR